MALPLLLVPCTFLSGFLSFHIFFTVSSEAASRRPQGDGAWRRRRVAPCGRGPIAEGPRRPVRLANGTARYPSPRYQYVAVKCSSIRTSQSKQLNRNNQIQFYLKIRTRQIAFLRPREGSLVFQCFIFSLIFFSNFRVPFFWLFFLIQN